MQVLQIPVKTDGEVFLRKAYFTVLLHNFLFVFQKPTESR